MMNNCLLAQSKPKNITTQSYRSIMWIQRKENGKKLVVDKKVLYDVENKASAILVVKKWVLSKDYIYS